jgi:hypothetical protein
MAENSRAPDGFLDGKEGLWRRRYQSFVRLYKGRDDVIAERLNGEYVALEGAGLTFERFMEHIRLQKTYALYNKDDAGMVNLGLFDVDVVQRNRGWDAILPELEEKKKETALIMQTLRDMGLQDRNMLLEFPTVGFHLLIFFNEPVPAKELKALMRFVLASSGLEHVPSYPKKTEDAPWGDRMQLPLRINLNTSKRSNFIRDLESFAPERYDEEPDFPVLEDVVPIDAGWLSDAVDKEGLK